MKVKNQAKAKLNSIIYALGVFKLSSLVVAASGIPLIGVALSALLRGAGSVLHGAGHGAEALSEIIRYDSLRDAQRAIDAQTSAGARVEGMYNNGDQTVSVKWDVTDFQGEDIAMIFEPEDHGGYSEDIAMIFEPEDHGGYSEDIEAWDWT